MDYRVHWTQELCIGKNGAVVAGHPQAAEVGLEVLQEGGNAVDASIATAAAMNVISPGLSGLGGDVHRLKLASDLYCHRCSFAYARARLVRWHAPCGAAAQGGLHWHCYSPR